MRPPCQGKSLETCLSTFTKSANWLLLGVGAFGRQCQSPPQQEYIPLPPRPPSFAKALRCLVEPASACLVLSFCTETALAASRFSAQRAAGTSARPNAICLSCWRGTLRLPKIIVCTGLSVSSGGLSSFPPAWDMIVDVPDCRPSNSQRGIACVLMNFLHKFFHEPSAPRHPGCAGMCS